MISFMALYLCQVLHIVDFWGSRRMETAPTSIEVLCLASVGLRLGHSVVDAGPALSQELGRPSQLTHPIILRTVSYHKKIFN